MAKINSIMHPPHKNPRNLMNQGCYLCNIVMLLYFLIVIVVEVADVLSSDYMLFCSCFYTVMFVVIEILSLSPAQGLQM